MESIPQVKVCTKCLGEPQPIGNFYLNSKKNGLHPWCKQCIKEANALRRAKKPKREKKPKQPKADRVFLDSRSVEYRRAYYARNRERILERRRAKNNSRAGIKGRKPTKPKRKRITCRVLTRKFRDARARDRGVYTREEWNTLLDRFGNKCLACNRTGVKLTVDHVIPISKGGSNIIYNLQPLCMRCNLRKGTRIIDYRL